MRRKLKKMNGERMRFVAKVGRFGTKPDFGGGTLPTILLEYVRIVDTGDIATQHIWFTKGKSWDSCKIGDFVEFDARVKEYEKGYKGHRIDVDAPVKTDYKLERPTKVVIRKKVDDPN